MSLNSIFQFLVPKDKKFFPLFEEVSGNLIQIAETLNAVVNAPVEEREAFFKRIEALENRGDELTHQTYMELGRNFITPFDREDIHSLAKVLDDVADYIYSSASKMSLYKVEEMTKPIIKLTELILQSCKAINVGVMELRNLKNIKNITDACTRLNSLETQADYVFEKAVAELFEHETDAKNILKYKEVLSALEDATDKCKRVGHVLEAIAVKHA